MPTCVRCSKKFAREGNYDNHRVMCAFRHTKKASFDDLLAIVAHLVERVEAQDAELVSLRRSSKKTLSPEEWLAENHPASEYKGILLRNLDELLILSKPFETCLQSVLGEQAGFVVVKNIPYYYETEWMKMQASQTEALVRGISKQVTSWFNDYVEEHELVGHDKYPEYASRIYDNLSKIKKIVMDKFKINMN